MLVRRSKHSKASSCRGIHKGTFYAKLGLFMTKWVDKSREGSPWRSILQVYGSGKVLRVMLAGGGKYLTSSTDSIINDLRIVKKAEYFSCKLPISKFQQDSDRP